MEFTNTFHVPLPIDQAWVLLLDVPRIMPCLPGAKLTEVVGPGKYKGSVSVKLGPVSLTFNGLVELVKQDDVAHIAWLKGSGVDPKGRGGAQSEFSFALTEVAGGTDVLVTTNLALSGAVAQYGRGSGMISEVAAQILKQFEKNLNKSFAQTDAPAAGVAANDAGVAQSAPAAGVAAATAAVPASTGMHAPAPVAAMAAAADGAVAPAADPALASAAAPGAMPASTTTSATAHTTAPAHSTAASAPASATPAPPPPVYRQPPPANDEPVQEINMLAIGMKAMWRSFLRMFGIGKR